MDEKLIKKLVEHYFKTHTLKECLDMYNKLRNNIYEESVENEYYKGNTSNQDCY